MITRVLSADPVRYAFPWLLRRLRHEEATGALVCSRGTVTREVLLRAGNVLWVRTHTAEDDLGHFLCRRGRIRLDAMEEPFSRFTELLGERQADGLRREHAASLLFDMFSWTGFSAVLVSEVADLDQSPALELDFVEVVAAGVRLVGDVPGLIRQAGPLTARVESASDVPLDLLRQLAEDTCVVLGAVRGTVDPDAPWPADFRLLQCLWELRLLDALRPAQAPAGVEVASLLGDRGARPAGAPSRSMPAMSPGDSMVGALPPARARATPPAATVQVRASSGGPTRSTPPPAPPPATASNPAPPPARQAAPAPPAPPVPPRSPAPPPATAAAPPIARGERPTGRFEPDAPASPSRSQVQVQQLDANELAHPARRDYAQGSSVEWFRNGEAFLKECDLHNAVTSFRRAVELDPKNTNYLFRLATVLTTHSRMRKEAEQVLLRGAELKPWDVRFNLALGKLYADAGLGKKAEACYKGVLEHDAANSAAKSGLKELGIKPPAGGGLLDRLTSMGRKAEGEPARPASAKDEETDTIQVS